MRAVIVGATGLVGSVLLNRLLADPQIQQVISLSRRSADKASDKLKEILVFDLNEIPQHTEQLRGDLYFCCLGTTIKSAGSQDNFKKVDFDAVLDFAKVAKHHDAKSFSVISAAGANARSMVFYSRVKGQIEQSLKGLDLKSLNIFRPGLLVGDRKAFRLGERMFMEIIKIGAVMLPENVVKRISTPAETLAEKMLQVGKAADAGVHIFSSPEI